MSITRVAVRELCEFTAKHGDLDLRFTPAPSARQGIAGHAAVTARRGAGYQREVRLESRYQNLHLRGRADGLATDPLVLEEIKTHRGDLARLPDNHRQLHWAQLKIYGAQLCAQQALPSIRLSLVYYDIDRHQETPITADYSAESLRAFHDEHCERYQAWDAQQQAHRIARDAALAAVVFPHAAFHGGQRSLAEAVYRASGRQQSLLVQAPTGIGKSIGTLFPALKALGKRQLDKIFFLTAKTSGRQIALDALSSLSTAQGPLPLRVLELVARDKACVHPDRACHGESCPLAQGFYDRLPAARADAVARGTLDHARVRDVAAAHAVCPYYLGQDLARWSDVIVGDYNYYFDLSALRRSAPAPIKKALTRVQTAWRALARAQTADYCTYPALPQPLVESLRKATAAIGDWAAANPTAVLPELQAFHFDVLNFLGLAEAFGEHSMFDIRLEPGRGSRAPPAATLSLRNIVPAPFLAPRVAAAHSLVAFSATLNPAHYYRDLLGLPASTDWLDLPSPFSAEQLDVRVIDSISTRYQHRAQSLRPIADLIAAQYRQTPGNYLAFFSSYAYLDQVAQDFAVRHAEVPFWTQGRGMSEAARSAFLARFSADSRGIGFAVLGGAFAEGIDLPGSRLIGAFVATLGLPQLNPVNEEMRQRMEVLFGRGYDYVYLYPGLRRVVQAAGRVIRTRDDRGVVYLIDDRYAQSAVQRLLPTWWGACPSYRKEKPL